MRLTRLRVEGFRNLREIEMDLEPITVIIGENNAGKSNVLEAISAGLRVNRTVRQGAFTTNDYFIGGSKSMRADPDQIKITVTFAEHVENEWNDDLVSALNDVVAFDETATFRRIQLSVSSQAAVDNKEEQYDWNFLDGQGNPLPRKPFAALTRLQTVRPFYYLSTVRDATRDFSKRSTYFSAFIKDPKFEPEVEEQLVQALHSINDKVMASHESLSDLQQTLAEGHSSTVASAADTLVEAVPSRVDDLLSNTQISVANQSGAALPLDRQGSGIQSVSVMALFKAYVNSKLAAALDPLTEPILAVEEPESHLHPTAARAVWNLLKDFRGQIVLTSHSGDLLSEVPMTAIRRLAFDQAGDVVVRKVDTSKFTDADLRHINYYVRQTRGELFFARAWLLVEGRTELSAIPAIARIIGTDFNAAGIRVVEYAQQGGPAPYIKLADQLGIGWHCLCDGDSSGQKNAASARDLLEKRVASDHITVLPEDEIEAHFCVHGCSDIYEAHVASQKAGTITATKGTKDHANQLAAAIIDRRKERAALEVCDRYQDAPEKISPTIHELVKHIGLRAGANNGT